MVERLHLDQLVSMLPAALAQDIEFGVSDAGDPWCAVMNGEGEVVLHVARIDGRFFVHSTVEPFVADSNDLPSAIAPFVGDSFLERRHIASVTPMYGLMMPLHAYAQPGTLLEQPGPDWAHEAVALPVDDDGTPALPDAPDVWTAEVIPLNAQTDAAPPPAVMDDAAALFPIQESDWPAATSAELLDFSSAARLEAVADVQVENVSFEAFVLPTPAEPVVVQAAETSERPEAPPSTVVAGPGGDAAVGGNVVTVEFGSSAGAGFTAAHTGALDGLARAAAGEELSIDHLDPIVIAWTDQPAGLMGVAPAVEAF